MAAPPLGSFDQNFMQPILLYAFAGAVLGGIDSALGAVVGSLALGVFLNVLGTYVSWVGSDLRQPAALAPRGPTPPPQSPKGDGAAPTTAYFQSLSG